jgi:hypothetical protein
VGRKKVQGMLGRAAWARRKGRGVESICHMILVKFGWGPIYNGSFYEWSPLYSHFEPHHIDPAAGGTTLFFNMGPIFPSFILYIVSISSPSAEWVFLSSRTSYQFLRSPPSPQTIHFLDKTEEKGGS